MQMKVFSVRDMKAEAFLQPFFSPNHGTALRAFDDACQKQDSPFFVHPNDFVLFEIGEYLDETGFLSATVPVKMIACAADFVRSAGVAVPELAVAGNGKKQTELR